MGLKKEKYQKLRLYCNILEALLLHSSVIHRIEMDTYQVLRLYLWINHVISTC